MKIRFQADEDLNEDIVTGFVRREPSIDLQTASAAKIRGYSDEEVLRLAASQGRIVVSHDRKTMPLHFGRFVEVQSSPGIIIVSQSANVLGAIQDLLLICSVSDEEEWVNRLGAVPL